MIDHALHHTMSFPYLGENKELNDETRKSAGGSFVKLTDGITHYELSNPEGEDTVVLVHGFSVPYIIFDPTFDFLTRSGFRVLRYDLFGRGFSDRPRLPYNIDLFVKQLSDLLDALRITSPLNLIGLSMGGPITASFTARYPERIKSLTLIDPAGARPVSISPLLRLVKMPIVAETVFGLFGSGSMLKSIAADFFDTALVNQFLERFKTQIQFKGFKRAIISTVRNGMLDSFIDVYRSLGKMDKAILLFWGRNDTTVPFSYSHDLCAAMPDARLQVIEDTGHIPHYEKPDEVNRILLEFLK